MKSEKASAPKEIPAELIRTITPFHKKNLTKKTAKTVKYFTVTCTLRRFIKSLVGEECEPLQVEKQVLV